MIIRINYVYTYSFLGPVSVSAIMSLVSIKQAEGESPNLFAF